MSVLQAAAFLLAHVAGWALIAVTATVVGRALIESTPLRRLTVEGPLERFLVAITLGLGVIGQCLLFVGLVGGLKPSVVWCLLVVVHLVCWRQWRTLGGGLRHVWAPSLARRWIVVAFVLVALTPALLLALGPPTTFDATLYHLVVADAFVQAEAVIPTPEARYTVFPQLWEMLYALALLLADDVIAKLVHFQTVPLIGGLIVVWGRRHGSPRMGALAGAAWLGTPLVLWIGTAAYVDLGMTLFTTAAAFAWYCWRQEGERSWLALAAIFVGFAASVKYLGLFFLAAFVADVVLRGGRRRWVGAATALVLVGLVAAPWYLRIYHHTGNPVYPFYASAFGSDHASSANLRPGIDGPKRADRGTVDLPSRAWEGLHFLASTPWRMIFNSATFGFQAPLHPWLLFLVPFAVLPALTMPDPRRWMVVVAAYCVFWLTLARDLRFLLPILPMLYLATMAGWGRIVTHAARHQHWVKGHAAFVSAVFLLASPGFAYSAYKLHERGMPPVSAAGREQYLARWVAGYGLVMELNRRHGEDYVLYALGGENLRYYVAGTLVGDQFGVAPFRRVQARLNNPPALAAELDRHHVSHFMIRPNRKKKGKVEETPAFERFFERVDHDQTYTLYRRKSETPS